MTKKGVRRFPDVPLQPVVIREMRVRCGPWSITGLRVNRHLQPFDQMSPHAHSHGQLLLYLRGRGIQRVGGKSYAVSPGSVFFLPAGMTHGFEETGPRRAICLVADWRGEQKFRSGFLAAEGMAEVRNRLSLIGTGRRGVDLGVAGTTLQILSLCLSACDTRGPQVNPSNSLTGRLTREFRRGADQRWPSPAELSRRVGLQKDYLNRLIRSGTGLTLGQWRAKKILAEVEKELRRGGKMVEVAERCGFMDANYFTRWFRRQTGMTPKAWQKKMK
ncbi:AraC family transcriptional regulator [bacterium]|nr:AraC family transcriptional regulator [bacterium]